MTTSLRRSSSDSAVRPGRVRTLLSEPNFLLRCLRRRNPSARTQHPRNTPLPHSPNVPDPIVPRPPQIPFARRNLQLNFWDVAPDATISVGCLTRQDILADIRQNWAHEERSAVQRIPRLSREHRPTVNLQQTKPQRRPRGRGRGRLSPGFQSSLPVPSQRQASGNRLIVRDMRQIDPSFTATPAIWVREDAMVVTLESVRAIILHNRVLLFDPDSQKVKNAYLYIKARLLSDTEDAFLPFEFRALEGILVYACVALERDFLQIEPHLRQTLGDLPSQITNEQLEKLRLLEQQLNHYYARARKVQQALQALLDEDEDMADMYLTEKRKNPSVLRNPIDHDEAEVLLETYLQTVDDLTSKAELLNRAIDDTENLIEIHLDTMQNRLLLVDLIITIVNAVLSFATMVTSIFGMNFPLPTQMSSLPSSKFYFLGSVLGMIFITLVAMSVLTQWCRRQGIYSGRAGRKRQRTKKTASTQGSKDIRRQMKSLLSKSSQQRDCERYSWEQSEVDENV